MQKGYVSETRAMPTQRRMIHFFIRASFLCIGIFLLWKFISTSYRETSAVVIQENTELGHDSDKTVNPVILEVYYESMCPDSKYFIVHQLVPVMSKMSHFLTLRLIPYGKARTFENATGIFFTCQHGARECQGNKVHACAIHSVDDQAKLLKFVSCLINNIRNPWASAENCATEAGVDWNFIKECATGKKGSELLKSYGEETHSLNPPVSFIPTIALNKSQENQQEILKNLFKQICVKFGDPKPAVCT